MRAEDKSVVTAEQIPADAFPIYSYREPKSGHVWFVSDGEQKSGNDELNCGTSGSPIIIFQRTASGGAELVKLICLGCGHHVVTYTEPDARQPKVPARAFVSNLLDGSVHVIANDPGDSANYLQILETINLCEPDKEKDGQMVIPNNAFPHGQVYSARTGKVYSFNNGYSTVAVIDPVSCAIESRIEMKVSSNLLLSPDERFLIGKGADRKTDAEHVMGRLSVIDIDQGQVVTVLDLADVYPSVYRFSPDGTRLYVTTAATGKGVQHDNLNIDSLLVYDASKLPELTLLREVKVGVADCGRRPIAFDAQGQFVFIPNPTDATVSILDSVTDTVIDTVSVGDGPATEVNFSFWRGDVYGA
jgi:YVTN family beta-propeller protein